MDPKILTRRFDNPAYANTALDFVVGLKSGKNATVSTTDFVGAIALAAGQITTGTISTARLPAKLATIAGLTVSGGEILDNVDNSTGENWAKREILIRATGKFANTIALQQLDNEGFYAFEGRSITGEATWAVGRGNPGSPIATYRKWEYFESWSNIAHAAGLVLAISGVYAEGGAGKFTFPRFVVDGDGTISVYKFIKDTLTQVRAFTWNKVGSFSNSQLVGVDGLPYQFPGLVTGNVKGGSFWGSYSPVGLAFGFDLTGGGGWIGCKNTVISDPFIVGVAGVNQPMELRQGMDLDNADPNTTGTAMIRLVPSKGIVGMKLAAAPSAPEEGMEYYDTVTKHKMLWNGTTWKQLDN